MDTKHYLTIGIIASCALIIGLTVSFAYFSANITHDNVNETGINSGSIGSIVYNGEETYEGVDIYPGMKAVQTFTIEKGSQEGTGIYEIDLEGVVPEVFGSDIEITLYKTTEPVTNNVVREEGELTQTSKGFVKEDTIMINGTPEIVYGPTTLTNSSEIILEQADFDTETLEKTTYYLVYDYKDNGNQNAQQGQTFSGKVTVKLIAEKTTFAGEVVACSKEGKTGAECLVENASLNTEELVYDGTVDNNLRYIRANPNNYVSFGNETYPEGTVINKWEEIDLPVSSAGECNEYVDSDFSCSNYENLGFSTEEECTSVLPILLEEYYNVSSVEELKTTYCVTEDKSNQPILWRIIGVMNNIDDGTETKETRLKVIRDEPYSEDKMAWDTDNVNDWTTASLQEELNGTYLNSIQSPYQEMIDNAVWNLGGSVSKNNTVDEFYAYERGSNVDEGNKTTWTGKIGLIYPSDYGYAPNGINREKCLQTSLYYWNNSRECYLNNWLFKQQSYWTITHFIDRSIIVAYVDNETIDGRIGAINGKTAHLLNDVYPSLYLNSDVKITAGDGSEDNPFILSL